MRVWDMTKKEEIVLCDNCGVECTHNYESVAGKYDFCENCLTMFEYQAREQDKETGYVSEED